MNPYRSLIKFDRQINVWQNIFSVDKNYTCPACNACNKYYNYKGEEKRNTDTYKGCLGKRSFWLRKQLCPNIPHLHIECWSCKLKFLMWSK